jgi:hypothetical protein
MYDYYSKLSGDAIYTSTCLLNLQQCIEAVGSSSLLDLVFTNFSDYDITFPDSGIIKPDTYHPPMVIGITLPLVNPTQNCEFRIVNMHLEIIPYYILFSLIMTGLVCMTPVL